MDGVAFTYDAIGNPLTYHNGSTYTMSWTEGRKLATITVDGATTSYLYDADGIRIQKTNSDGSYIRYIYAGGVLLGEKHYSAEGELTKILRYIFDENGAVCGYMSSTNGTAWTQYYFVTNLQGDVLQVYRINDREVVASYSYDSWGNITSKTGELADENPFRYRGYYYDSETGFYYLNSRYYDSEIGRFVNADGYVSTGQGVSGHNMFTYCGNNPISRKDTSGRAWETIWDIISLGSSIVEVCANPTDPWAWAGLAGDVVDVAVPCVGGVGEAIKASKHIGNAVEAADTIHDASKAMEVADDTVKQLHRPYIRKATREAVEKSAAKLPDGRFLDANTLLPINGKYDLGHVYGHEFWRERERAMNLGWTQKQFNDYMNNPIFYQIEDPISNRSHFYEMR